MSLEVLSSDLRRKYYIEERRYAASILKTDYPEVLGDITDCLMQFKLLASEITVGGGGKSKIASRFDNFLLDRGWREEKISVKRTIGDREVESETHKVDFCKDRIAVEVEWNNKDPFFSRDLNAFRLLHELDTVSVGVIITRRDELQEIFDGLKDSEGKSCGRKYGASTTHWSKLIPRVEANGAGTCPLLLVGITKECYEDDRA